MTAFLVFVAVLLALLLAGLYEAWWFHRWLKRMVLLEAQEHQRRQDEDARAEALAWMTRLRRPVPVLRPAEDPMHDPACVICATHGHMSPTEPHRY